MFVMVQHIIFIILFFRVLEIIFTVALYLKRARPGLVAVTVAWSSDPIECIKVTTKKSDRLHTHTHTHTFLVGVYTNLVQSCLQNI